MAQGNVLARIFLGGLGGGVSAYSGEKERQRKSASDLYNDLAKLTLAQKLESASPEARARADYYRGLAGHTKTKPLTAIDARKFTQLIALKQQAASLLENFDANEIGPLTGRKSKVSGALGFGASRNFLELQSKTAKLRDYILNELSGAAISPAEAERLAEGLPDVTYPPDKFIAAFNATVDDIDNKINNASSILSESGYNAQPAVDLSNAAGRRIIDTLKRRNLFDLFIRRGEVNQ